MMMSEQIFKTELLRCHEYAMLRQAARGRINGQTFCKVEPKQLEDVLFDLDQERQENQRLRNRVIALEAQNAALVEAGDALLNTRNLGGDALEPDELAAAEAWVRITQP